MTIKNLILRLEIKILQYLRNPLKRQIPISIKPTKILKLCRQDRKGALYCEKKNQFLKSQRANQVLYLRRHLRNIAFDVLLFTITTLSTRVRILRWLGFSLRS